MEFFSKNFYGFCLFSIFACILFTVTQPALMYDEGYEGQKRRGNIQEWGDGVASSDAKCIEGPSINCTECTNLMLYSGLHAKSLKFVWAWRYTLPIYYVQCSAV